MSNNTADLVTKWQNEKVRQEMLEAMFRWNQEFNTNYTDPKEFLDGTSKDWDNFKRDVDFRKFYQQEQSIKQRISQNTINRSML